MKKVYTSIDFGTDSIKIIVAEYYQKKVNVLASSCVKASGIKRGLITNPEEALKSLQEALNDVQNNLGIKIKTALVNVPSYLADFTFVSKKMNIHSEDSLVTGNMCFELMNSIMKSNYNPIKSIIDILPIRFSVDDNYYYNPKGIYGKALGIDGILIETPKKNVMSVLRICEMADIDVADISICGIGDYYNNKNNDLDTKIGGIVNIGSDTTNINIYNKGVLVKNDIIGMGGKELDNDLAYMYHLTLKGARQVKENFVLADSYNASNLETYEIKDDMDEYIKINQHEASEVVSARIEDMLLKIKETIREVVDKELDYIIFTGGISNLKDFKISASKIFKVSDIIENVQRIGIRDNRYSVSYGNICYFINKLELKDSDYSMITSYDSDELSSIKRGMMNTKDSAASKLLGAFFGE